MEKQEQSNKKLRLMTGDRPTGRTYTLGHYIGTIRTRIERQEQYDTLLFIADYHALTTNADRTAEIKANALGMLKTMISMGVDPEKVTFYRQSKLPQTFQLHVILSMLTAMPELERQPMLKEKLAQGHKLTYGLMGYPVLMSSDIMIVESDLVPVGKDNEAHIELAKDLARRVNSLFGHTKDDNDGLLKVPEGLIGDVLIGLDGKGKSGKSTGGIGFTDTQEEVKSKIMGMFTDPNRIRATDPGRVDGNPVFIYHDYFNPNVAEVMDLKERYLKGAVGDVEVKQKLLVAVESFLAPIREKRAEIEKLGDDYFYSLFEAGEKRVGGIADVVIARLSDAMGF